MRSIIGVSVALLLLAGSFGFNDAAGSPSRKMLQTGTTRDLLLTNPTVTGSGRVYQDTDHSNVLLLEGSFTKPIAGRSELAVLPIDFRPDIQIVAYGTTTSNGPVVVDVLTSSTGQVQTAASTGWDDAINLAGISFLLSTKTAGIHHLVVNAASKAQADTSRPLVAWKEDKKVTLQGALYVPAHTGQVHLFTLPTSGWWPAGSWVTIPVYDQGINGLAYITTDDWGRVFLHGHTAAGHVYLDGITFAVSDHTSRGLVGVKAALTPAPGVVGVHIVTDPVNGGPLAFKSSESSKVVVLQGEFYVTGLQAKGHLWTLTVLPAGFRPALRYGSKYIQAQVLLLWHIQKKQSNRAFIRISGDGTVLLGLTDTLLQDNAKISLSGVTFQGV